MSVSACGLMGQVRRVAATSYQGICVRGDGPLRCSASLPDVDAIRWAIPQRNQTRSRCEIPQDAVELEDDHSMTHHLLHRRNPLPYDDDDADDDLGDRGPDIDDDDAGDGDHDCVPLAAVRYLTGTDLG